MQSKTRVGVVVVASVLAVGGVAGCKRTSDANSGGAARTVATMAPGAAPGAIAVGGAETDDVAGHIRAFAQSRAGARPLQAAVRATLGPSQSRDVDLSLTAGRCVEIVAAGGQGVGEVDLELADAAGTRVATESLHAPVESVRYCPTATGTYRLTVRAAAGAGVTGIQAFEVP